MNGGKKTTAETLLTIQTNWLEDVEDRIDAVSRLLSTALEQNNPVIDVCWYMTQSIADEIVSERNQILSTFKQIDKEESKRQIKTR